MKEVPTLVIDKELLIRKPKPSDKQERVQLGRRKEFVKMVGGSTKELLPYTLENAEKWYEREVNHPCSWFIEYQGRMIGVCRITFKNEKYGRYSIGIYDDTLYSKGIGTKITNKVVEYAFKKLKLFALDLMVLDFNKRAISCYEKCGFKKFKLLKDNLEVDGKKYNDVLMRQFNEELLSNLPEVDLGDLLLRPIELSDYRDVYDYGKNPEVTKFLVWDSYNAIEEAKEAILNVFLPRPSRGVPAAYAIVVKENSKMIGTCDFHRVDFKELTGEIGYVLHPDYWGKGFMTKVCKVLMDFGYNYLGLETIEIGHEVHNMGSRRVIEKCGFRFLKEEYHERLDMHGRFYELTKEEYKKGSSLL